MRCPSVTGCDFLNLAAGRMAAFQTGDYPMVFTGFLSASKVWLFLGEIFEITRYLASNAKRSLKFNWGVLTTQGLPRI